MGILTLLRNAFGRSRKEQAAPAEGATQETAPPVTAPEPKLPSQPTAPAEPAETPDRPEAASPIPEPRSEPSPDEHDLVKAAFTNITVPKPTDPPSEEPTPAPDAAKSPAPTPEPESEPEAKTTPAPKPATEPDPSTQPQSEPETNPEPQAESEPEPQAEPEPKPQPEPQAESEPEPEPGANSELEPGPELEPQTKSQPEPGPEPEPQTKSQPEPEAKAEPQAEQEPEQKPEPAETPAAPAAAAPEPAAADGEDTPQGPPAPDDETSTGGAGGKTDAEGEAEASKPATTPAKLRSRAPGLTTAYKAAGTTLKKHDLTGTRAKVHLILDRSASMRPYYKDGSAQALAEQTLALAAHLDPEATVHVTFFSTEVDGTGDLTLTDHENKIDELHAALGRMGRTSYHAAVEAVLAHHTKEADPGTPALVIFQTDGAPDAKTPATQSLTDAAANHPNVHFSFVAFGDPENKAFDYLRKLKTGNASHFLAGETPKELTDRELYEGVLAGWRP
ncbi:VWA domain-containing protein [Streptomyces coelicoflavus]|uniref:VWA domain-containing protein n=1 Tax=Streptomyces coelicoflavus TaxID=285562 RepID=A0A7K3PNC4_9ACTN|nr:VWA domain-containing protein [Streptomyces coelicoflavus]NEB11452.1 VWA domain-containing protein [Streptomyces coelicoflavus]